MTIVASVSLVSQSPSLYLVASLLRSSKTPIISVLTYTDLPDCSPAGIESVLFACVVSSPQFVGNCIRSLYP